jgi:hypothetical protein
MIRSMPRWKGSVLPLRLSAPSAKMQTTWPAFSSAWAWRRERIICLGLVCDIGIACIRWSSQCSGGMS